MKGGRETRTLTWDPSLCHGEITYAFKFKLWSESAGAGLLVCTAAMPGRARRRPAPGCPLAPLHAGPTATQTARDHDRPEGSLRANRTGVASSLGPQRTGSEPAIGPGSAPRVSWSAGESSDSDRQWLLTGDFFDPVICWQTVTVRDPGSESEGQSQVMAAQWGLVMPSSTTIQAKLNVPDYPSHSDPGLA